MSTQSETSASLDTTRTQPKDCCLGGGRVVLCPKKQSKVFSVYVPSPTLVTARENPIPGTFTANYAIAKNACCNIYHC